VSKLRWKRTDPPGVTDDYTGKDPDRPLMYARVRLTDGHPGGPTWAWGVNVHPVQIGSGGQGGRGGGASLL
jgi:hypothetical protein